MTEAKCGRRGPAQRRLRQSGVLTVGVCAVRAQSAGSTRRTNETHLTLFVVCHERRTQEVRRVRATYLQ